MDHRNLYKTSRSRDITQMLNKRRELAQKQRSEERNELYETSRNIQSNRKSKSAPLKIVNKQIDYMSRYKAWKEEKLKGLENQKKAKVKPFVSAAFKSSFPSNSYTFVPPNRSKSTTASASRNTITCSKPILKVVQKASVKEVPLIQSSTKHRNTRTKTSTLKANNCNAIVKPNVSHKKPKLKTKTEHSAVKGASTHFSATPVSSPHLNFDAFIKATSTQVKPKYSSILDFSISPLTLETTLSNPKSKAPVPSEKKTSSLDENDLVKFCDSESNKRVNHVNDNRIERRVKKISKGKALEYDEMRELLNKKVTKPKKNSSQKPGSLLNDILRTAHEAYVQNRQKSTGSKNNIPLLSDKQLTRSLTPSKRLLKSQAMSSKVSIGSSENFKTALSLRTWSEFAANLDNYQNTLRKSVLDTHRTTRLTGQQGNHKLTNTSSVINEKDIMQDSDEQRSLHLRRRRVVYRPDSEIIIP